MSEYMSRMHSSESTFDFFSRWYSESGSSCLTATGNLRQRASEGYRRKSPQGCPGPMSNVWNDTNPSQRAREMIDEA